MKKLVLLALSALPLLATAQTVPSYVPTSGLVGWWPFNGNANDESGNGNNGTVNGATLANDRNGNANSAYSFDGNGDYIQIPNNPQLVLSGDFSISCWANMAGLNSFNAFISNASNNQSNVSGWVWGYYNYSSPPKRDFQAFPYYNTSTLAQNGNDLQLNNWNHVLVSYELSSSTLKYYLNGAVTDSFTITYNIFNANLDVFIGNHFQNNNPNANVVNSGFWGLLDDFGIWNRSVTPCEIQALYNSGNSGITTAASSSSSICFGSSTTLSASGAATYSWMPGNLSGDSLSVSPAATTTYIVTGTDSSGCNSIDSVTIVVNALPQVIGVSTTSTYCLEDANGSLAGTPTPGTWSGPGVTGNSFNPATAGAGTHNIVYTYTDNNGCSNSDTLTMTVDLCTGLTEETNSSFTVFPNPANNNITVTWAIPNVNTLTLSDATGRAVRTYNVSGTQAQLSLEGLASGVYFLSVNGEDKAVQKIIKN
jgi:hypothetical protein